MPLRELTESGRFCGDLYYRLAEVFVELPALRERPDDVPVIAQHIVDRERPDHGFFLEAGAIEVLKAYAWPGNVRELRNLIRRALELSRGSAISAEDLGLQGSRPAVPVASTPAAVINPTHRTLRR